MFSENLVLEPDLIFSTNLKVGAVIITTFQIRKLKSRSRRGFMGGRLWSHTGPC